MKDKIIFADGTEKALEASGSLGAMVFHFQNWEEAVLILKKLSSANLAEVKVKNGDGLVVGNYADLVLQPGGWKVDSDGVWITISLREKTEEEKRLDALEKGQEIQDGAIIDLAGIVGGEV